MRTPRNARATRAASRSGVGLAEIRVKRHGYEVRRRVVGPEPAVGDHLPDQAVIAAILEQHVAQPGDEPPPPVQDERPILGADINPCEPLGQVVGAPAVARATYPAIPRPARPFGRASKRRISSSEGTVPHSASDRRRMRVRSSGRRRRSQLGGGPFASGTNRRPPSRSVQDPSLSSF